ncbi:MULTISPECIES: nucleotide pyrophosphohydrolase [unclassified Thiomonas]|uniref:nucleotide pyrophosphohydrolase n=1 Tax=unclassified Thiomonas TaxID=2625466 RepID=UPI000AA48FBF|nr:MULTISPECIES: nucleotide pyrophosphohydrolase [unclassified Thiomonas]OZB69865.1 MAG: nucleotide pyrophosphohydrolase [Thiomonas sp. 13-64-67]
MDIPALQARLRQFSVDRNWAPYQTPKNLAMAMIVEAGELVEIFQWMTPEQSQQAGQDPEIQQHLADEIADVLIYLVQIADHTGVDLQQAVEQKIGKNALKYPAS